MWMKLSLGKTIKVTLKELDGNTEEKSLKVHDTSLDEVFELIKFSVENHQEIRKIKSDIKKEETKRVLSNSEPIKTYEISEKDLLEGVEKDLIIGLELQFKEARENYGRFPQKLVYVLVRLLIKNGNRAVDKGELNDAYKEELKKLGEVKGGKINAVDWFSANYTTVERGDTVGKSATILFRRWITILERKKLSDYVPYSYKIKDEYFEKIKSIFNKIP